MGGGVSVGESKEPLQAKWWEGWWAQDWSWARLADKPVGENGDTIHGGLHGERDLQAYWRRDPVSGVVRDDGMLEAAGELLRGADGRLWHLAHVPLHWRGGEVAKAGWDADGVALLAEVIAARTAAGCETAVDWYCNAEGADGRAQLTGAVLLAPPPHPGAAGAPLHLVADWAWLRAWDAGRAAFGPGFRCDYANFYQTAMFVGATFSGKARFDRATFSGDARFDGATFSGFTRFIGASFLKKARFTAADFSEDASFGRATFSDFASFDHATFSGFAGFGHATFLEGARFNNAAFSGTAGFDHATFSNDTYFMNGEFAETASFRDAKFGPTGARPERIPSVSFRGRRVTGPATFDKAEFYGTIDFSATAFARLASFAGIIWPNDARHWHQAFNQAVFKDVASFQDAGFRSFAAFDGAVFQGGLQFDEMEEEAAASTRFKQEMRAAIDLPAEATRADPAAEAERHRASQNRLKQLERGCRVLKQAMDKASDKTREQVFYAFELIARRKQSATPRWECAFSRLYEFFSD